MMAVTFNMVSYKCHHTIQRKKPPSQSKDDLTFQDLFKTQACQFFKKFIDKVKGAMRYQITFL